jgi:hypothetical protein
MGCLVVEKWVDLQGDGGMGDFFIRLNRDKVSFIMYFCGLIKK